MAKVVAIGGMPGTGKTTLMKEFMKGKEWKIGKHNKLLAYHYNEKDNIYVLGLYEEAKGYAQGTDRLSMAVHKDVEDFFSEIPGDSKVLFEGDRLFTANMLEHLLEGHALNIIILTALNLEERYQLRNSNQSEKFLKGRKTKYSHISSNLNLQSYMTVCKNEDRKQLMSNIETINNLLGV